MAIRIHDIQYSCNEDWKAMQGDQRQRHCARCERPVLNLSALTLEQARRALSTAGPVPCIRGRADGSGLVQLRPSRSSARKLVQAAAFTVALVSSLTAHADGNVPAASKPATQQTKPTDIKPRQAGQAKPATTPKPKAKAIRKSKPKPEARKPDHYEFMGIPRRDD